MPTDFGRVLEPLRDDLAHAVLAHPESVRRRGDRRTRNVALVAAAGVLVIVAGIGGVTRFNAQGGSLGPGGTPTPTGAPPTADDAIGPRVTSTPSSTPTTEPTQPAGDVQTLTNVPDTAMLPELRGVDAYQRGLEYKTFLSPPRPCAVPGETDRIRWRVGHNMMPGRGNSPEVVIEYVAQYEPGFARQYMRELHLDLDRCKGSPGTGEERNQYQWSIVESGFAGDESDLIRLRANRRSYQDTTPTCCGDDWVAVIRKGDLIVTVTGLGWETTNSDRQFVKQTAIIALTYAESLTR